MAFADIFDYVLNHKILPLGAVVAILVVLGVVRYLIPWLAARRSRGTTVTATTNEGGPVQQTVVGDVKAKGNVDISPRQQ
jgi:hypothetical protein